MTQERDIDQMNEARVFAAQRLHHALMEEIGEAEFRRFIALPDRPEEFVKHEYAEYTMTHLEAILRHKYQDTVSLNITECSKDDELEKLIVRRPKVDHEGELVDPIQKGKIDGIEMALDHLSGDFPLKHYKRRDMERLELEGEVDDWGITYPLPTLLDGVSVCYFYPDEEPFFDEDVNPEAKQVPSISLRIEPLVG